MEPCLATYNAPPDAPPPTANPRLTRKTFSTPRTPRAQCCAESRAAGCDTFAGLLSRMHEAPLRLRSDKPQVHDLPGALASCLLIGRFRVFVWFSDEVPGGVICARGRPGGKDCSPVSVAAGHVRAEADFAQRSAGHAPDHRRCLRHEHRLRARRDHGEAGERGARTDPGARRTAAT
jgi:hypothetical protein